MPYQATIAAVRQALTDIFAAVDGWFDRSKELRRFRPPSGGWSIDQILEHVTLTNHFLLLIIRRWTAKAVRKARRGEVVSEGESELTRLDLIGERGSFAWVRPEHMEPTGVPTPAEVRERMRGQVAECLELLAQLRHGEGALCKVRMSVNGLGKIDLYQWLYFLAQHARRHLQQLQEIERRFREPGR
ncbi:MAG TPA: DinB family protein [Gemmataceae bacterium]|nr:DinB family protein [Gemmataceae bacterium]